MSDSERLAIARSVAEKEFMDAFACLFAFAGDGRLADFRAGRFALASSILRDGFLLSESEIEALKIKAREKVPALVESVKAMGWFTKAA